MIIYLDTCSILNLLQANYSDEFLVYLEKEFDNVFIAPIVLEELEKNKYVNIIEDESREILDEILDSRVSRYVDKLDVKDANGFTLRKNLGKYKPNGESHSVSHSLNFSRFGGDDISDFLLNTHILTDDHPAKEDFNYFSSLNLLGKFLDSIDIVTFFWLKGYISRNQVLKYCDSIKQLYFKDVSLLIQELKILNSSFSGRFNSSERLFLVNLIDKLNSINEGISDFLIEIRKHNNFKKIKSRKIDTLMENIIGFSVGPKINYINSRMKDLEKVWLLEE
jgi:hypothetical protein